MDLYHCTINIIARHWGQIGFCPDKMLFIHPACKREWGDWGWGAVGGVMGENRVELLLKTESVIWSGNISQNKTKGLDTKEMIADWC